MAVTIGMSSRLALQTLNSESGYFNPQKLAESTGLSKANLQQALRMAENKTLKWVVSQFTRNLSGHLSSDERVRITLKALKDRIRVANASRDGHAAKMWAGVYDMNLRRFGVGRATGQGYTVGQRYEEGAFKARFRSGHEGIMRRLTTRRLPIYDVTVPLKQHAWTAVDEIMNRAEEKLAQELKQALKYLMLKRAGAA